MESKHESPGGQQTEEVTSEKSAQILASVCDVPQRILIVLMGSIGDVARGLTVAQAIKQSNPQHTVGWVVEPASADLVTNCPSVDTCIVFERHKRLRLLLDCVRHIRQFRATLTIDLQRHLKSGFFSFSSGAPIRIGFHRKDSKEGNFLFQTHTITAQNSKLNKLLHYWEFLKVLNISVPEDATAQIRIQASEALKSQLGDKKIVGLVLGTRWASKMWPQEGYLKLLELLSLRDEQIVLLGSKAELQRGEELKKKFPQVINFSGKTTIEDLCYIIRRSRLIIGPDSGPAHISALLGTPHVTLFGATDPDRTAPFGFQDLVVEANVPCRGCYRKVCPGLGTLCMRSISPQQVLAKALEVLD